MIPIQNIYYMLAYAFDVLNAQGYKNVATEEFENVKAPNNSHSNLCMNIYTFIQFECKLQITNSLQPNTKVFSIVKKVQNRGFDPKIGGFTLYIQL